MTDKPRKPPPLRPKGDGPELVRIGEDAPAPDTEKVPIPLPEPKALPLRPPAGIVGIRRAPNLLEEVEGLRSDVAAIYAGQRETIATQRSMARQLDGHGQTINQRFDIFHEELALTRHDVAKIRAIVEGDHGPRLEKVESSIGQKAAKGGGILAIVVLVLPMLADALPKYAHLFDAVLRGLQ